ncbi:hypothetical protein PINS_up015020 [Pythium insidiosum]|nr:hypothetical protein PINS_up015020 [Pythium insidiosum]
MALADKELGISAATQSPADFQYLTDHVINRIEASKCNTLEPARKIIRQLRCRQLYEFIDDNVSLSPEDIIVADNRLNYNLKDRNPVDHVAFYSSNDLNTSFHISKDQVSLLFPEKFEERVVRVYSRSQDPVVHEAIQAAFRRYLRQFSTTLPPPSPSTKVFGLCNEHETACLG